jgi:hypothetical protein
MFKTLHFLCNSQIGLECYISIGWKGFPGTNTLAYLAKKKVHIFNIQTGPCRNTFSRSDCRNGLQQRLDGHLYDLVRSGHGESAGEAEVQALEQPQFFMLCSAPLC